MAGAFDLEEIRELNCPATPDDYPIDPCALKLARSEIVRLSYSEGAEKINELGLQIFAETALGFAVFTDRFYIFYSDHLTSTDLRDVLFHEFGHIVEEHVTASRPGLMTMEQEARASQRGLEFQTYPGRLLDFGITTPEQIREKTGLTAETAEHVARQVAQLERKRDDEEARRAIRRSGILMAILIGGIVFSVALFFLLNVITAAPYDPVDGQAYYWSERHADMIHADPDCRYLYGDRYDVMSGSYETFDAFGRYVCELCRDDK